MCMLGSEEESRKEDGGIEGGREAGRDRERWGGERRGDE